MKKIIKFIFVALFAAFVQTACSPDDDHNIGNSSPVTLDQVTFTYAKTDRGDNVLQFTNTSLVNVVHSMSWDLGNGTTTNVRNPIGIYPNKGTYTVSLSVTTADGNVVIRTQSIVIAQDDPSLFDTPTYRNLTGGADNAEGKTWVYDQYNLYTAQVKNALDKDIRGHMGLGPPASNSQGWWGAGPNEKSYEGTLASVGHGWKLYDWKLTFSMANGLNLKIETSGEGYGRQGLDGQGFNSIWKNSDDMAFLYNGGDYKYDLVDVSGDMRFPTLTLSGNAFMGYYVGTQLYTIIYLTEEVMAVSADNNNEGQEWIFIFIREDLNIENPVPPKELKEVPFFENFEGAALTAPLKFDNEDMGSRTNLFYQNPAPVPINQSSKVALYEKSGGFYSNISYTADYKFDLTTLNKIRMKVYLPGYNNYNADGQAAGDWIANKKLQKMVAVKLQDSSKGGNAWENQTEITFRDLPTDTWINLIFDFSGAANRTDYDKMVIQFGGEGHSRSGIFFFDDLELGEEFVEAIELSSAVEQKINGEDFLTVWQKLEKGVEYTLTGDWTNANVLFNVDFFERTANNKVKFLGETGEYNLHYNPVRKNVIPEFLGLAELPNFIIAKGVGIAYPTTITHEELRAVYPNAHLTAFEVWDDKNIMQYVLFRKLEAGVFQGTILLPGNAISWGWTHTGFNVYEGLGKDDDFKLKADYFTGGYSGTATSVINAISTNDGDWVISNAVEQGFYRFTINLNDLTVKVDNFDL